MDENVGTKVDIVDELVGGFSCGWCSWIEEGLGYKWVVSDLFYVENCGFGG